METLGRPSVFRLTTIGLDSRQPTEFIDLTDEIEALVTEAGIRTGLVNIQSLHTTTAIVVDEHEPLLLTDMTALLERLAPQTATYRHDMIGLRSVNCALTERPNGHSHCRTLLLNPSVCLNIAGGRLSLGRWQRVFLAELDGPRHRELSVLLMGEERE